MQGVNYFSFLLPCDRKDARPKSCVVGTVSVLADGDLVA